MEAVLAEKYGFCAGVRVADKLVRIAAAKGQTGAILGQVVHNESVEREMADLGFPTVHRLEDARGHEGRIVFSAHGVAPSVRSPEEVPGPTASGGETTTTAPPTTGPDDGSSTTAPGVRRNTRVVWTGPGIPARESYPPTGRSETTAAEHAEEGTHHGCQ